VILGSHLVASLVSFQASAEAPGRSSLIEVKPRAPLVMAIAPREAEALPVPVATTAPPLRKDPQTPRVVPFRTATSSAREAPMTQQRMLGYITGGLGIVGLGFGATTTVMSQRKEVVDRQCVDPLRLCSPDVKASSAHTSLSTMSAVGWAVGIAGLSAGAYLIITSNRRTGTETAIGTDFYHGGAGLKVRRYW
jgi:hypothetical protein